MTADATGHSGHGVTAMDDARRFNIRDASGRWLCPACGYPDFASEPAYDDRHGLAGTAICSCCMWEPGFDDDPAASTEAKETILASLRHHRAGWEGQVPWLGRMVDRPEGWNGASQLQALFEIAPHVR